MRFFWLLIAAVTLNDISCDNTIGTSTISTLSNVQCHLHNFTDMSQIKASCDNETVHLFFKNSHFERFPQVFEYFHNLRSVDLSNAGVQHISITTFEKAVHLIYLNMDGSNITTVQNSVFSHANTLTSFEIQNSSIVAIEDHAFQGLLSLMRLDLSYNNILHLGPDIFKPLSLLKTLRMTNNKLQVIGEDLFKYNINLGLVYFSSNEIILIGKDLFIHTKLVTLDVGFNQLTDVDLTTMTHLRSLKINNNKLTTLIVPPTAFEIHAEGNNISLITSDGRNMLKKLHLSSNCFNNLQNLDLFNKLQYLDLSKNLLQNIQFCDLKNLTELKELRLTGNKLSEIKANDVITNLPKLAAIGLSTKHWSKQYIDQLREELRYRKIMMFDDYDYSDDDAIVVAAPSPSDVTSQPTTRPIYLTEPPNTNSVEKRLDEMNTSIMDLELSKSNETAKKIDDRLKEMEDKMMNSGTTINASKTYRTLTIIMFVAFLIGSIGSLNI